jgi:hypothetical protein
VLLEFPINPVCPVHRVALLLTSGACKDSRICFAPRKPSRSSGAGQTVCRLVDGFRGGAELIPGRYGGRFFPIPAAKGTSIDCPLYIFSPLSVNDSRCSSIDFLDLRDTTLAAFFTWTRVAASPFRTGGTLSGPSDRLHLNPHHPYTTQQSYPVLTVPLTCDQILKDGEP